MPLYVITGNVNKFKEVKNLIPNVEQLDIDLPEIQETDPKKIIEEKLREAQKHHTGAFLVEDNSFSMECLNGLPGPLIKWFLKTLGTEGLAEIAEKLGNTKVIVTNHVGYVNAKGDIFFTEASDSGRVVPPRGNGGFGWDTIFLPDGSEKTYAEIKETNPAFNTIRVQAYNRLLKDYIDPTK